MASTSRGTVRIGISGWRYAPWRKVFYPDGLPQRDELAYAARQFDTIELNGSFYSLQTPSSWRAWDAATPDGFVFAVKASGYLTHRLRLKEIDAPLANFLASGLLALGPKLGPLLWQFPPSMRFDPARFEPFVAALPRDTAAARRIAERPDERVAGAVDFGDGRRRPLRHAIEVRHASFVTPEFFALLRAHGVAPVVADTAGRWPLIDERCADFVYVRLHGDKELYASGYEPAAIARWAQRIAGWRADGDVYVYFDNDIKVHAPYDAIALREALGD